MPQPNVSGAAPFLVVKVRYKRRFRASPNLGSHRRFAHAKTFRYCDNFLIIDFDTKALTTIMENRSFTKPS